GARRAVTAEEFVGAARALGCSPARVAVRHVLPNIVPPLLIQSSLTAAAAIIAEASLSFLGLGQQPPAPSWGSMLNAAQRYLSQAPWIALYPGLMIFTVVMALNVVGDGLRDALDPRVRGGHNHARRPIDELDLHEPDHWPQSLARRPSGRRSLVDRHVHRTRDRRTGARAGRRQGDRAAHGRDRPRAVPAVGPGPAARPDTAGNPRRPRLRPRPRAARAALQ